MTPENAEHLGTLADKLDAGLYPMRLAIPDATKIDGMAGIMREVRDAIVEIVRQETGEDPWEDEPLEG